jgi:predicted HTH transcriptional regulator
MHLADSTKLLERLCAEPVEAEWLEFKHNHFNAEEIGQNISALANSAMLEAKAHAFIVFGIDDKTHDVLGTNVRLRNEKVGNEPLETWLSRMLEPRVSFGFFSVFYKDRPVEIIVIDPAYERPVRFKQEGFVRIGSVTKPLVGFPQKEGTLWQLTSRYSFEEGIAAHHFSPKQIVESFDCETLAKLLFKSDLKERALVEKLLMSGLIVDDMQGGYDITNLFALIAANDLSQFKTVANKAPRVITYKGTTRLNGQSDITGHLGYASAFRRLLSYVMERSPHKEVMQTGTRTIVYDYPEVAVREFIANAMIHQDLSSVGAPRVEIFSNRIEISNPGTPLVAIQRFIDAPAKSRNEKLAGLMRQLGFCEERGSGIDRAVTAIETQTLPPPSFAVVENTTVVALFRQKDFAAMSKEQRRQACYLHACLKFVAGDRMGNASLRSRFGLSARRYPQISIVISDAIDAGLIKPSDEEQGNRNARYVPFWAE